MDLVFVPHVASSKVLFFPLSKRGYYRTSSNTIGVRKREGCGPAADPGKNRRHVGAVLRKLRNPARLPVETRKTPVRSGNPG